MTRVCAGGEVAAEGGCGRANLGLGQATHASRHQQARAVRVLVLYGERVSVIRAVVRRNCRARLDRVRHQPVVDDIDLRDVLGFRELFVDAILIADRPRLSLVARRFLIDQLRTRFQPIEPIDDGRQHGVI